MIPKGIQTRAVAIPLIIVSALFATKAHTMQIIPNKNVAMDKNPIKKIRICFFIIIIIN